MDNLIKVAEGFHFLEGPRWHENKLWFSDMHGYKVHNLDADGNLSTLAEIPEQPSGLGWLPDGSLIIVSMLDRKLMKLKDGELSIHADMSHLTPYQCNDMVVAKDGTAYVGNFGTDSVEGKIHKTCLISVTQEGETKICADGLLFPNGTVISPDGKELIVGETFGGNLTSFQINESGELSKKTIWARVMPLHFKIITSIIRFLNSPLKESNSTPFPVPDGICLDSDNGIWVASPTTAEVIRYKKGGKITDRIATPQPAYACMLGGKDEKELYILTAESSNPQFCKENKTGEIYKVEVDYERAGKP